jgi:hypothetical protein
MRSFDYCWLAVLTTTTTTLAILVVASAARSTDIAGASVATFVLAAIAVIGYACALVTVEAVAAAVANVDAAYWVIIVIIIGGATPRSSVRAAEHFNGFARDLRGFAGSPAAVLADIHYMTIFKKSTHHFVISAGFANYSFVTFPSHDAVFIVMDVKLGTIEHTVALCGFDYPAAGAGDGRNIACGDEVSAIETFELRIREIAVSDVSPVGEEKGRKTA